MLGLSSNEDRRMRLMARLAAAPAGTVVDVGCAARPNPYLRGATVIGLDREPFRAAPPYDEALVGDASRIDALLAPRRADAIVAGEVIEHLENPYRFLRACRAAVGEAGRLVLSTPNPLHPPVLLCEALGVRRLFYTEEHLYYFLPRWVRRLLESSGWRLERQVGVGVPLLVGRRPVLPAPAALSYQVIYVARPTRNDP